MPDTHKVHYRTAAPQNTKNSLNLESILRNILEYPAHGSDYTSRMFEVSDSKVKAFINRHDADPPGVLVELLPLDSRRALAFVKHPEKPVPQAAVLSRGVPSGEDHLGIPAYFLVIGNHLAVIEAASLRSPQISNYINIILKSTGRAKDGVYWKLVPKVQVEEGKEALAQAVTRLEIRPIARLIGDAPSEVMPEKGKRESRISPEREEKRVRGSKIFEILSILGASESDLQNVRSKISTDLGLEAKVVITVARDNRKTTAAVDASDFSQAIASMEDTNAVKVVSPELKQSGNLVTLSR